MGEPYKIIRAYPPNYRAISERFPIKGRSVIFAYGNRIYNPHGTALPAAIVAHESKHLDRQAKEGGADVWWQAYLDNREFRLAEEVLAHQVEWQRFKETTMSKGDRFRYLQTMVSRLISPVYDFKISAGDALNLITSGEHDDPAV